MIPNHGWIVWPNSCEPVSDLVPNDAADADPARFCECLQTRRDIYPVAEDVVFLGDHVAKIDADAKPDPSLLRHLGLALGHPALDLHRAADGVDHARKLCQEAVAGAVAAPPPRARPGG
jgi:hypothetical protein